MFNFVAKTNKQFNIMNLFNEIIKQYEINKKFLQSQDFNFIVKNTQLSIFYTLKIWLNINELKKFLKNFK